MNKISKIGAAIVVAGVIMSVLGLGGIGFIIMAGGGILFMISFFFN